MWVSVSVRCDGYTWSRCSHHDIGLTANITTCAGVGGGRGGGRGKRREREGQRGREGKGKG